MKAPRPTKVGRGLDGPGRPCIIIAEIGSNHDGKLDQALAMIAAAAKAGADAVKFQSHLYGEIFVPELESAAHRRFFKQLDLPESWYGRLKAEADKHGVMFLSCPTYDRAVDLLAETGVPAYKIASPQTHSNLPLLARAAARGLPLIISTGYCDRERVRTAVRICERAGNRSLILLHCVSEYPAPPEKVNLRAMASLAGFGYPVGLSDHTMGSTAAAAAVALGACVVEKHLTLNRGLPGPDHSFACQPSELAELVRRVRETEAMLGDGNKRPTAAEEKTARAFQLRLIAGRSLDEGTRLKREHLILRRAPRGLPFEDLRSALGRRLRRPLTQGQPLLREALS